MFGWRKRRDGFEWRHYVRTTILVRRERRRQRIDELRDSAIENLVEVGRKGADVGAAGLDVAQRKARHGMGAAFAAAGSAFMGAGRRIRPALSRFAGPLGDRAGPLLSAPARIVDRVRVLAGSWHLDSGLAQVAMLLAAIVGGTSAYSWWSNRAAGPLTASLADAGAPGGASSGATPSQLSGRASAVSGDTLRISNTIVRLGGIEAPERGQSCVRSTGKKWDCGQTAAHALTRHLRGKAITCDVSGRDAGGLPLATCRAGDDDIAAQLVTEGHVFADTGLFAAYSGLEAKAREQHTGLWAGEAERPAAWRAKRWEEAKKAAPDGCPIKGQVSSGARLYLLPWAPSYERVKVRTGKGERWFCSEQEAIAAGWKADPRTSRGNS